MNLLFADIVTSKVLILQFRKIFNQNYRFFLNSNILTLDKSIILLCLVTEMVNLGYPHCSAFILKIEVFLSESTNKNGWIFLHFDVLLFKRDDIIVQRARF